MYISSVSDITCPRCQGSASKERGKPYCSKCGWNLIAAESRARESLKQTPFAILFLALFFVCIYFAERHLATTFVVFALFVGGVFTHGAWIDWMELRKIKALRAAISGSDHTGTQDAVIGSSSHKLNEAEFNSWDSTARRNCERVVYLAAPRSVRLSHQGKIELAIILFCSVVAFLGACMSFSDRSTSNADLNSILGRLLWLAMLLLFVCIGAITSRHELRKRRIIIEGEATLAKIVGQATTGGKGRKSKISYVFKDRAGKLYDGSGYDSRRELFEEMPVVVFYDTANPSDNVAECEGNWDIVAPPARIH
jgi:hypothetical protein